MKKDLFSMHRGLERVTAVFTGLGLVLLQFTGVILPARVAFAAAPTCNGLTATIYVEDGDIVGGVDDGESYAGTLSGTAANDVIVGTSGNDTVNGGDGNDTICGGAGNDTLNGESGEDWIDGQDGNDTASGGADTDTVMGGNGDDSLSGEGDSMNGGDGNDFCDQGDGTAGQNCEAGNGEGIMIIKKNAVPDGAQDFAFVGTNGLGDFSLDDDDNDTLSNTKTFAHSAAGSYMVTETLPDGWTLSDIDCDAGAAEDLANSRATYTVEEGDLITCTFTNTQETFECNDGEDNDDDGLVDLNDSGCANAQDDDEAGTAEETECDDDEDNDDDGKIDAQDPGCWGNSGNPSSYNPLDNDESNAAASCPDADAPIVFPGVRAGFMAKLQIRKPEIYAKIVAHIESRRAKLARLCQKHPHIFQKIMTRREAILEKHAEKREQILEKWENKENQGNNGNNGHNHED